MFVNGLLFLMYGFTAHLIVYTICKPSYLSLKHFFSRALTYLVFQSYISLSMFVHGFCNDLFKCSYLIKDGRIFCGLYVVVW